MAKPRVGIIIPARYASSRYPGKPLARISGAGGAARTLIERSWRAASAVPGIEQVEIATDDTRIADEARRFGAAVVMTPTDCRNGTERCAAAIAGRDTLPDIIVNLQGDAPLTPAHVVSALVARMAAEPDLPMATPAVACSPTLLASLVADQEAGRVGGTTVVFDRNGDALYFSKRVIPYMSREDIAAHAGNVHLHMGVYAYRPAALATYMATPPSRLEQHEGLEQLRFLDAGIRVGVVACPAPEWDVIELNNPTDLPMIEAILRQRGLE